MLTNNSQFIELAKQLLGCELVDVKIEAMTCHSQQVTQNTCFLALAGHQVHGSVYNQDAADKGASLILCDTAEQEFHGQKSLIGNTVCILVCGLNELAGELADLFYAQPSMQLSLVGVTGTNGKTSVCEMIYQLATQLDIKPAYMGTLGVKYKNELKQTGLTTPDAVSLQGYLADFVQADCELAAIEVSSHAVVQHRVNGCQFDKLAFTNLSHDHLDYHQTMAQYFSAKADLFLQNPQACHLINTDHEYGQTLIRLLKTKQTTPDMLAVGRTASNYADKYLKLVSVSALAKGFKVDLEYSDGKTIEKAQGYLSLIGEFNIENLLIAMASLLSPTIRLPQLIQAAEQLTPIAGRMEVFSVNGINLVVDFAHTPDGLAQALAACRVHCQAQLWVVFGCGGDRDKNKRAEMGAIAQELADKIVLTNDNPRSESQTHIISDITRNMTQQNYQIELDRKQAIRFAYQNAKAGDYILIAGKGHETYQEFSDGKIDYNERAFVAELIQGAA